MAISSFQKLPQAHKFMIGSIPDAGEAEITVEAQYNPKELQIESPITWTEHKVLGAQSVATKPMEFTAMGAETVKVELLFDAFEDDTDYVVEAVAKLKQLASVRVTQTSRIEAKKQRPSFCVASWGTQAPFRCVIESINVKYTMFSFDGTPVRATVLLGLKSGVRTIDEAYETDFERSSREREQRKQVRAERTARQQQQARERERMLPSESDRRLAERENRVAAEQRKLDADREAQQREIQQRAERIQRERRVAEDERRLADERAQMQRDREQRKKDFDLE
jgi:hypothetical protein